VKTSKSRKPKSDPIIVLKHDEIRIVLPRKVVMIHPSNEAVEDFERGMFFLGRERAA
jgi:hypothetical protein